MALIIESGQIPDCWANRARAVSTGNSSKAIRLAFINNMPDAALEDTELQFFELLDNASVGTPVSVRLYSLTGVPRTERGQQHLDRFYSGLEDLWNNHFDGVIITGTEPREPELRNEPYWRYLTDVFDWVAQNTTSAILSCLAAHASVLYYDGIQRYRLPDKKFGVFESAQSCDHFLTKGASRKLRFPHSRWNEVRERELTGSGYLALTSSPEAGVDIFTKKLKNSLFVHLQGHPEYSVDTLMKEYRRDIKRFLRGERETYPSQPQGYFDDSAGRLLENFKQTALADRRELMIESFPESVASGLRANWQAAAICVYQNWLDYLASRRDEASVISPLARVGRLHHANNEVR